MCTFAPVLVPSLASGMEYCHGCTFAPVLVPTPSCYTHYNKSQILEFLQRCPLQAARYRSYKLS
nr:MAG TPA: hypothetical protein [Caudoviricetes sp.]